MDFLEFSDALQEVRGAMYRGRLKLTSQEIIFKNVKTGKVDTLPTSDIDEVNWQRIAGAFGLRVMMNNGQLHRFGGLKETDHEKLTKFFSHATGRTLTEKELSVKGWNWGTAKFNGSVLSFDVGPLTAFEIPLNYVSHCTTAKNEVTLEFHPNDDASVQLMELRFHIPTEAGGDVDAVQAFRDNVMSKANVIQATGEAIATVKEVQCITPRGRYDIKLFPTFIQLHGKTFDYKIPMTTVLRLFLLPHKDQRQMFFVVSLDPPIKQGLTRYHFLILQFAIEEETMVELGISEEEIAEKYEGKIQKEMSGPTYEVISRIMKALVQRKITVPGNFLGNSGTPAVSCSFKAAAGFLYPLERGFIYVPKPPIHIRFEEVDSINFARSGGSTRSFDFEVEIKSGTIHTFSSIEKEEYGKLYDFITARKLRIKNKKQTSRDQPKYADNDDDDLVDSDVEAEPDAYLARVKAEAKERDVDAGDDDSDDESDVSFNPGEGSGSEVAEEYDSNAPSSESSDEEGGAAGGTEGKDKKRKAKEKEHKPKKAKTVSETRKPRKKKEREDGRPKRPQSAYFLWLNDNRERIKKENPGISMIDISKKAGEQWREITDKKKYEKLAEEAKKDYEKAMEEFKAAGGGQGDGKKDKKKTPSKESKSSSSPLKSSPQKSGSFKSKEYISSSEGSSSDGGGGKKKKKKAAKKETKKEIKKEVKEEKKSDPEEDEEEEEILSTPSSSEKSASGEESGDDGSD